MVLFLGLIVVGMIASSKDKTRKKHETLVKDQLKSNGIELDHILFDYDSESSICIDDTNSKVVFTTLIDGRNRSTIFDYNEVLDFEVKQNDTTSYKNSLSGALVGGVVAGGVGAIIGSQRNKKAITVVNNVTLILTVKSIKDPVIYLQLIDRSESYTTESSEVFSANIEAEKWNGIFKIVFDKTAEIK